MRPLLPPQPDPDADLDPASAAAADLAWDAYRYLTDALGPAETIRFERQLARDQEARAALAAAVDIVGALAIVTGEAAERTGSAPSSLRSGRSRRVSGRVVVLLGGLASAAAVILALAGLGRTLQPGAIGPAIDVALAWIDLRSEAPANDLPPSELVPPEPAGMGELAATEGDDPSLAEVPAEQPVPSWMLAAISPAPEATAPQAEGN